MALENPPEKYNGLKQGWFHERCLEWPFAETLLVSASPISRWLTSSYYLCCRTRDHSVYSDGKAIMANGIP